VEAAAKIVGLVEGEGATEVGMRSVVDGGTTSRIARIRGGSGSDGGGGSGCGREVTHMTLLGEATSAAVVAAPLLAALEIEVGGVTSGGPALVVVEALHSGGGGGGDWEKEQAREIGWDFARLFCKISGKMKYIGGTCISEITKLPISVDFDELEFGERHVRASSFYCFSIRSQSIRYYTLFYFLFIYEILMSVLF